MDFFEHQEQARKSTTGLLFLFVLAVAAIVGTVYLVVVFAWQTYTADAINIPDPAIPLWDARIFGWTAGSMLGVIALGSLWKTFQLRGGGPVVARRLGGRRIDPGSTDEHERRVLNVVQEMALASGVPVPDVYLLDDEAGINAFAAGYGQGDAVIGVTRGSIKKLSRDELQGVMAHEFSHLLNGDMRLNLKLIAVVHGILLIALIGRELMRSSTRSSGRKKDGGWQIVVVGFVIFLIGYVGVFFANLIKAAVSRQREFLADASAVQFTRNPSGISGALQKIGGYTRGSRVGSARAVEVSHMFFGDGMTHRLTTAMATHPPLAERIKRIDPSWSGRYEPLMEDYVSFPSEQELLRADTPAAVPQMAGSHAGGAGAAFAGAPPVGPRVPSAPGPGRERSSPPAPSGRSRQGSALDRIGNPGPEHLQRARALWDSAPEPLREAARHPESAVALAYAVLMAPEGAERARQLAVVEHDDPAAAALVPALLEATGALEHDARLPLLEVAAAALGTLPPERFSGFSRTVRELVEGDRRVDLSEWMLSRLLLRHVRDKVQPSRPPRPRYRSVAAFPEEAAVLISALAHAGHDDAAGAERAFAAGAAEVGLGGARLCAPDGCPPRALEAALETFALLFPEEKRRLVTACAASVAADARVLAREAELFRVVSDWLGAPVPPLLPGQLIA